jgi:hypothetical protein
MSSAEEPRAGDARPFSCDVPFEIACREDPSMRMLQLIALCLPLASPALSADADPISTVAIAGFDYSDSSGEPGDRSVEHLARTRLFAADLERRLTTGTGLESVPLPCAAAACTAATMPPDALLADARSVSADILVFGRIHKMSTLVGWGRVDVLDIASGTLLFDRVISFRGDNDEAFERAAAFAAKDILRTIRADRSVSTASDRGIR